jgi:hypothetical protein
LYHSSNNIQSAASVDVPGFGEPRKSACVVFYLCLLSVQYAQHFYGAFRLDQTELSEIW